jgi:Zn-dependent metalloprotease
MKGFRLLGAAVALSLIPLAGGLAACGRQPKADRPAAPAPGAPDASDAPEAEPTESVGSQPDAAEPDVALARRMIDGHLPDVKGAGDDDFAPHSTRKTGDTTHVRFTRTYHGLPVQGGDVVVHTDGRGAYRGVSNGLDAPLRLSTKPAVPAVAAATAARAAFAGTVAQVGKPRLIVDAASGPARLAWETLVVGTDKDTRIPSRRHMLTDAKTGKAYRSWDEIKAAAGTGRALRSGTVSIDTTRKGDAYQLVDPSHGGGTTCDMKHTETGPCVPITDADNAWTNDPAAVEAHYGAAKTFEYFKNVHGRNGIFNDGKGVVSRVHYGNNTSNAFWDGKQMTYYDGVGNANPFISLDVAGHEMSHGVTQSSVPGGLDGGEAGGINEATSDIFGAMVEFYVNNPNDPPDYTFGEEIAVAEGGKAYRYMYDPALDGSSSGCWSTATKDAEVHDAAGPANHFFFALAEGTGATKYGTSPVCGSAPAVTGIGRAKAEKIWYRALDVYFTSTTSYVNTANPSNTTRAYTLRAAQDLYGKCGVEYKAVRAAWTAVNVAGNDPACP